MPDINRAYQWAINTCNAPNVGYSNDYRNQQTVNGITYYDCSSFIWYALLEGGFDVEDAYLTATGKSYKGNAITTANERAWLIALGFVEVPLSGEWLPGDILWRDTPHGHTEMVYTGGTGQGISMGAHQSGIALDKQVSINTYTGTAANWGSLWRYGGGASAGISIYVIAAICGNWYQESHINPGYWEGGSAQSWNVLNRGYGLGQWTNVEHPGRLETMIDWLTSNGYAVDDGYGQLAYFLHEDYWLPGSDPDASQYATLTDFLQSTSTDMEHLVRAFCRGWEGISGNIEARVENAEIVLSYLREHGNDTTITSWIVGNRALTRAEANNNAVLIFRWLGAGGGGGGTGTARKMPVWMYRPWWMI